MLVAINIGDFPWHKKRINLLVLQVSSLILARGQYGINLIVNLSALQPFFLMKTKLLLIRFSAFPMTVAPIIIGNLTI